MADDIFIDVSDNEQLPRRYISESTGHFRSWLNHLSSRTKDNQQLLDNSFGDLEVSSNPSDIIDALEQQYRQYFCNGDPESRRFCSETIANLGHKPEVLSQLAQNRLFLELLTDMLDGQNDQLVVAISELICHLSMDLQLDGSVINTSGVFKALVDVGKAIKKLDNQPVLVAVLKAMEYWTLVNVDNRKHILDIDGALELITSCLTLANRHRKWWERSSIVQRVVHNIDYFFQSLAFHTYFFYLFCPSILYRLWDYCFTPFNPRVPFGSGKNCSIIRDYLKSALPEAVRRGTHKFQESPFVLDNKAIYDLAVKYRPVRFPPRYLLTDPSIKYLLVPRTRKQFTWKDGLSSYPPFCEATQTAYYFYEEYEIFSPYLPSRKSSLTTVQLASRLLMSLSTDRFHGHESSMTHFRQHNIASLLGDEHVDFRALPVAMPIPERLLIQENACRTLVNVLDKKPEIRAGSEEWKALLDLEQAYNYRKLAKEDTKLDVFEKLVMLRTRHRTWTDWILAKSGRMLAVSWIIVLGLILCLWLFVYTNERVELYKRVHSPSPPSRAELPTGSSAWDHVLEFFSRINEEDTYFIRTFYLWVLPGVVAFYYFTYTIYDAKCRQFTTIIKFYRV